MLKPWYERLTPEQYEWLFGDCTPAQFLESVAERERAYGIPPKCEDPETLLRVARIFAA